MAEGGAADMDTQRGELGQISDGRPECLPWTSGKLGAPTIGGDVLAIKEHLIDELDYILIPTEGWNKLVSWYALMEGHEAISRKRVLWMT
ncbi:unnamed protein product [Oncorhynchus mykiss]|uniref:ubiquitinyl hydrolase 1 n=1 Tax=Oncorhynchus mykiss TaxID=8022 RepID=A0A060X673_ONCMY|nr:unnamed protein product [Oncorhynchus mykiss]